MNDTLVFAFLRQRLASPLRVILVAVVAGFPLLAMLAAGGSLSTLGNSYFLALIVSAGLIGQDVSNGTLQLLFARPVSRPSYVLSRWFGATLGAGALIVLELVLGAAAMALHHDPPAPREVGVFLANGMLMAAGAAAVVTLASSLVTGLGDLGLLLVAWLLGLTLPQIGMARGWSWMVFTGEQLQHLVWPQLDVGTFVSGGFSWHDLTVYLSTVIGSLAIAVVAVNRRELSYASANA
jgi:ABC-type transport system involved in multi-copper enzyme maturation permease subunit